MESFSRAEFCQVLNSLEQVRMTSGKEKAVSGMKRVLGFGGTQRMEEAQKMFSRKKRTSSLNILILIDI